MQLLKLDLSDPSRRYANLKPFNGLVNAIMAAMVAYRFSLAPLSVKFYRAIKQFKILFTKYSAYFVDSVRQTHRQRADQLLTAAVTQKFSAFEFAGRTHSAAADCANLRLHQPYRRQGDGLPLW